MTVVAPSGVSPVEQVEQVEQEMVRRLEGQGFPQSAIERAVALNRRSSPTDALAAAGNQQFEFALFAAADHSLLRWPLGAGIPPPLFASGYPDEMVAWATKLACVQEARGR